MAAYFGSQAELDAENRRIAQIAAQRRSQAAQSDLQVVEQYMRTLHNEPQITRENLVQRAMWPDVYFDRQGNYVASDGPPHPMATWSPYESMHPRREKIRKPKRSPTGTFFDPTTEQETVMVILVAVAVIASLAFAIMHPVIGMIGMVVVTGLTLLYNRARDRRSHSEPAPPAPDSDDLLKYHYQELADFDAKLRAATMNIEDNNEE